MTCLDIESLLVRDNFSLNRFIPYDDVIILEEREMGTAFSRVGSRVGPNGTQFIGDIQGRAHYGLPLKSHPVQDVIPKREPLNYIRNTLYPKAGSRFLLLPRQYVSILS